jgi:hypothetical protein
MNDKLKANFLPDKPWLLNELKELLGDAVTLVIETIKKHINCFFVQALQLDPKT